MSPVATKPSRPVIGFFLLAVLLITSGGYAYYRAEANELQDARLQSLAAVANLKVAQIVQWRKERLADVSRIVAGTYFRRTLAQWLLQPDSPTMRADWQQRIEVERKITGYDDVLLLRPDGSLLLSARRVPDEVGPATRKAMTAAIAGGNASVSDFYRSERGLVHLDYVAAVTGETGELLAVLVVRSNTRIYFEPLMKSWPMPSRSGETVLVQREGDEVVYLNDLRGRPGTALTRRVALSRAELPAVQAVLGRRGTFRGTDERGVQVLSDLRPVPGTPWFMVTKVDAGETLGEARTRAALITAMGMLLILLTATGLAWIQRRRQVGLYRDLYHAEREQRQAREEQRAILLSIGDAVIAAEVSGRVRFMNPTATALTGWSNEEAVGKTLTEIFVIINAETRAPAENPVDRVLASGGVVGLANGTVLIARDGREYQIADSAAPIRTNDGAVDGVVLVFRDVTEKHQAEAARRESDEKYRVLVQNASEAIHVTQRGRLMFVNAQFEKMTGLSGAELTGRLFADFIPAEDRGTVQERLARMIEGETGSDNFECRVLVGHGEECWLSINAVRIQWNGEPAALSMATDITERRLAEDAFRREALRRQTLMEASHDGIVILDQDHTVVEANERFASMLGYEPRELLGMHTWDWEANYSKAEIIKRFGEPRALTNVFESRHRRRDGSIYDVEISASCAWVGGEPLVFAVCRDITERKRIDAERERLLAAIEQSGEMVVTTLPDGTIEYVNPAFEQITGYTRSEAVGRNPRILKSGKHDKAFYGRIWETLAEGRTWQGRMVNRRKDGSLYTEESTISPVRDRRGKVVNYVAVKRDVSRELELEEQYRQSQKIESIGRLAGGVAHDFNNMLSVILGYTEMALMRTEAGDPLHRHLEEIRAAAQRSSDLTRQLLAFARKQPIAPRQLDLNETITGMLSMLGRLIGEDIHLVWMPARDLWPVNMDPAQINQILANLAVNARDAVRGSGSLSIETRNVNVVEGSEEHRAGIAGGSHVLLTVRDDGCGMAEETLSHLFEPFFTTKQLGQGTGLGLATVYGIVNQNHGFIRVQSQPGEGTVFQIYLPRHEAEEAAAAEPLAPRHAPTGNETILLVEDEPTVLELTRTLLSRLGYNVLAAVTPADALQLEEQHEGPIHLVVTDVVMPKMSGRELVTRLVERRPGLGSLFMSGYTADVIENHGVLEDGIHFLQKPFSREQLAARVREALIG